MPRFTSRSCSVALLLVAALAGCGSDKQDAYAAAASIEAGPGKLRPLSEVLVLARRIAPGKVIDVELESDVGLDDPGREPRWVYEIEILTADNHVVELEIDAVTGKLLEVEGAPWPADIPREQP